MKDPDDDLNVGCIPPEKKHFCPRCQEMLPTNEVLQLSYCSYVLFPILHYSMHWLFATLFFPLLLPFTWVCSLQCTKCREYLHIWRLLGLARKAAYSEHCGKRVPAVFWVIFHCCSVPLVLYYLVTEVMCFASWDRFQRDCGLKAQARDYQSAIDVFHYSYLDKAVRWDGTFYSGWYLGETSLPFPDDYEVCLDVMMNFRSPPEADLLCCLSNKTFQDFNATVRIGAYVHIIGYPEFTWNETRLPCLHLRWDLSRVLLNRAFVPPPKKYFLE